MLEIIIASILSFAFGYNVEKLLQRKDIVMAIALTIASIIMIVAFIYLLPIMHGRIAAFLLTLSTGLFVSSFVSYED